MDQVSERSRSLIAPTIEFEKRAAQAFKSKSLLELENLYADIALRQEPAEEMETTALMRAGAMSR